MLTETEKIEKTKAFVDIIHFLDRGKWYGLRLFTNEVTPPYSTLKVLRKALRDDRVTWTERRPDNRPIRRLLRLVCALRVRDCPTS